jgi:hypothetical protein
MASPVSFIKPISDFTTSRLAMIDAASSSFEADSNCISMGFPVASLTRSV